MSISKRRIVQGLVAFLIVCFVIRESRILWGIREFEIFDLGFWGIEISDLVYTLQNTVVVAGGLIALVMLRKGSPKVQTRREDPASFSHAPSMSQRDARDPSSEKGRERSPFEMANKKWKVVFPDEKEK